MILAIAEVDPKETMAPIKMETPLKVAVMGCVVNGPGEAREADIGLAGGNGVGIIFKKGTLYKKVPEAELFEVFIRELDAMSKETQNK